MGGLQRWGLERGGLNRWARLQPDHGRTCRVEKGAAAIHSSSARPLPAVRRLGSIRCDQHICCLILAWEDMNEAEITSGSFLYRFASHWIFRMLEIQIRQTSNVFTVGALSALLVSGCSAELAKPNQTLEEKIVEGMEFPDHSSAPEEYSRYFFKDSQGNVEAVFVIHEKDDRDGVKQACAEHHFEEPPCTEKDFGVVDAGQSKWVENPNQFPMIMGGGCGYISVTYNVHTSIVTSVECNGPY